MSKSQRRLPSTSSRNGRILPTANELSLAKDFEQGIVEVVQALSPPAIAAPSTSSARRTWFLSGNGVSNTVASLVCTYSGMLVAASNAGGSGITFISKDNNVNWSNYNLGSQNALDKMIYLGQAGYFTDLNFSFVVNDVLYVGLHATAFLTLFLRPT